MFPELLASRHVKVQQTKRFHRIESTVVYRRPVKVENDGLWSTAGPEGASRAVGGDRRATVVHWESSGASMAAGGRRRRRKAAETGCRRSIIARARPCYFKLETAAFPANPWHNRDCSMPRRRDTAPLARTGAHRSVHQPDKVAACCRSDAAALVETLA